MSSKYWKRVSPLHRSEVMLFRDELEKARKESNRERAVKAKRESRSREG
jgi:hypothetical protein